VIKLEKVNCPHGCGVLLKKDEKTGSLKCPRCGCIFRVVLVHWMPKCYAKHYPEKGQYIKKKDTKKKRGRGKKDEKKEEND